ncbi:Lrp/AsnC family transcriptional regulator [Vulcanisaeta sp. JCM 14467]|uniref:Lrp/AsnC family transcriptional regulator n=1 Tax=Vulcanisaeta sp. JCM 14467 TaxID=1295370 RepID=UPI0006D02914|nr:Lrp/AsnC family transcriptional regulator [Vulcanisaeta sp. JCM 14467]
MIMDKLDKEILREIQKDGRLQLSKLAEILNRPRTTVATRLARLEGDKVITSYRAVIDPLKVGFSLLAFVLISVRRSAPSGGKSAQVILVEKILKDSDTDPRLPWIEEAYVITGHYDLLLKVWAKDLRQLSYFLINYLPTHPDIAQTETMLVLELVSDWRDRLLPIDKVLPD